MPRRNDRAVGIPAKRLLEVSGPHPGLFEGEYHFAHSSGMQRQTSTHPRGSRDPLGSIDTLNVEGRIAVADGQLAGLTGQRVEILDEGAGCFAQLAAGVLRNRPQAYT